VSEYQKLNLPPPTPITEDEEIALAALLVQVKSELESHELATEFADMIEDLRVEGKLVVLPGRAILKQMAMIFDFGRRYEAVVQNDMRADKEE
jgi:hypothetical protein